MVWGFRVAILGCHDATSVVPASLATASLAEGLTSSRQALLPECPSVVLTDFLSKFELCIDTYSNYYATSTFSLVL